MLPRRDFLKSTLLAGAAVSGLARSALATAPLRQAPQAPNRAGSGQTSAAPASSSARIDIHVHLGRDQQEQFTPDRLRPNVSAAAKWLVEQMDKKNIEKSLIVPVDPIMVTETYMQAAKEIPDRLLAACSVIPRSQDPLGQLRRWRDAGARALKLQPMQYDPRDPAVERLVNEAVTLEMPVLFHYTDLPTAFPAWLEHLATTFRQGNFVVIHFGGIYGFRDVLRLGHNLPNVYLETSTAFIRVVNSPLRSDLHFMLEAPTGAPGQPAPLPRISKLIFGSEHPRDYDDVIGAIDSLTEKLPPEVRAAIYRGNAARILKL